MISPSTLRYAMRLIEREAEKLSSAKLRDGMLAAAALLDAEARRVEEEGGDTAEMRLER
jgi:hypothetical protein